MGTPVFALDQLGWRAFGDLCHTVLREVLGQTVVSFLDTNDGGRDGAFTGSWTPHGAETYSGEFVVQCKHTTRPLKNLTLSDLSDEIPKAVKLAADGRCDVYVLMTNAGVSGRTEAKIGKALEVAGVGHVLVLGSTWFDRIIVEKPRLRRLVPRLYGLGDLTQILDERAYRQAQAVLDSMRTDLAKLVLTGTFQKAATAVDTNRFVLLTGAPAVGKTTIAAQLALGVTDAYDAMVVKLATIADLQDRWNPDERQVFWLDDAFGATQFDWSSAQAWVRAQPSISSALDTGSVMIVTSRDYIFQAARPHLKPGAFPLLNESQVVVDVADLTGDERRQILYNHLRHGRQPKPFLRKIQPHLDQVAEHPGFTPELARRLSDPMFTKQIHPWSLDSVKRFFSHPKDFLRDVMEGLDPAARAALGLVFVNHNWLPSPITLTPTSRDLLDRLDATVGAVTNALEVMNGSLVHNVNRDEQRGWQFAHPTMADAYGHLLRSPELLHHFITGYPLDVLLREITCGDCGVQGALVVPSAMFDLVLERLDQPLGRSGHDGAWWERSRRFTFLATRCGPEFLGRWRSRHPDVLDALKSPGLMLEADSDNEFVVTLHRLGLFPEPLRKHFADELIAYCVEGTDPAVLWDVGLRSMLTDDEWKGLLRQVREESLKDLNGLLRRCIEGGDPSDAESAAEPLLRLAGELPDLYLDDPFVMSAAERLTEITHQWIAEKSEDDPHDTGVWPSKLAAAGPGPVTGRSERSIFDDLVS